MSDLPSKTDETPENKAADEAEYLARHVGVFIRVGIASVIFTSLTVLLSFVTHGNVLVALLLAGLNAVMVAYYTMHLKWERSSIVRDIGLSLLGASILFLITYLHYSDPIHL